VWKLQSVFCATSAVAFMQNVWRVSGVVFTQYTIHFDADKISTWSKLSRAEHWIKEKQRWHWQQKWTQSIQQTDSFVRICKPALKVSICHLWSVNELIRQQWTCTLGQTWLYKVDKCLHGCVKITHMHRSPHFPACVAQHFSASHCFGVICLILHHWLFWGFGGYLQHLLRLTRRDSASSGEHIKRWQSEKNGISVYITEHDTHTDTLYELSLIEFKTFQRSI
jgi:hypothetical protein